MNLLPFALIIFLIFGCTPKRPATNFPSVYAEAETPAVDAQADADAADDPAIWYNSLKPEESIIIGTVKKFGLEVYDLKGNRLHRYQLGNPNNVDVRYNFPLANGQTVDIVACTDRSTNQILVFKINPVDKSLTLISGGRLKSKAVEVYGICLYHNIKNKQFYAYVNSKEGLIEQFQLLPFGADQITGTITRTFRVKSQPEGMVADDALGFIYLGEEDHGVWKFSAYDTLATPLLQLIANSNQENPNITYDIEGLAIYETSETSGYLVVSSQGNNSYAVFDRQGNNAYISSFQIGHAAIDGTYDTDGIEICSKNLGGPFSNGIFIAQDGANTDSSGKAEAQNFKLVSWRNIAHVLQFKT